MKLLSFSALFVFLLPFSLLAQLQSTPANIQFTPYQPNLLQPQQTGSARTATCNEDTVQFFLARANILRTVPLNATTDAQAYAMYYEAPQPITISGFRFYAFVGSGQAQITQQLTCSITTVGNDSLPTTTLATVQLNVDSNFYGGNLDSLAKYAIFSTPVTVNGPYALVISSSGNITTGLVSNYWQTADGQQNWLANVNVWGSWIRSYNINMVGIPFDADVLMEPLVTYDIEADYTTDVTCLTGPNQQVQFFNSSSPILQSPVYNRAAFLNVAASHIWDFGDGQTDSTFSDTTHIYSTPGNYHTSLRTEMYGWSTFCVDSTTLDLHDQATYGANTSFTQTICQGDTFMGYTVTGVYVDTFAAYSTCDSIRTVDLTVLPNATNTLTSFICAGDTVEGYTATGTYVDTFSASNGCDSIRTLNLTVFPHIFTNLSAIICAGNMVAGYTTTGTFIDTFTSGTGCDSIRTLNLTVLPNAVTNITRAACLGDTVDGYTVTGVYVDTFPAANGCDSIRTLDLTVASVISQNLAVTLCNGDSALVGGVWQNTAGTYVDTFSSASGCDSIVTTTITIIQPMTVIADVVLCKGDSIEAGGNWQTTAGTYYDTISSAGGCDSVIIQTAVEVYDTFYVDTMVTINQGDSAYLGGAWQTDAGTYMDTYTTAMGCDSVVVTELEVLVGIEDRLNDDLGIQVYPNPVSHELYLRVDASLEISQMELLDITGRSVKPVKTIARTIMVEDLDKGLYLLKVTTSDGIKLLRFIKD